MKDCVLSDLPKGWAASKLGEIITLEYGKGLTESKRNQNGNIPVYGSNGIVGYHDTPLVNEKCLIVGRKGAAGAVHISSGSCWPIDTTYYLIPSNYLNIVYLYYLLKFQQLNSLDRSTAIPGLNRDDAYNIIVIIPPLAEQHRIVSKIEGLFTKLDAGVELLKNVKAGLLLYKKATLKNAFEGNLSKVWQDTDNDLKEWKYVKIGDICKTTSGGTPSRKNGEYYNGVIPWLKSGELRNNFITQTEEHISAEALNNSSTKIIPKGTILIALYGATAGKLGILAIDAAINQAICAVFTPEELDKNYLYWFLYSYRNELLNARIGGAQPNISQGIINNIILPLPSLTEQKMIINKIEQRFSIIEKLDYDINLSLKESLIIKRSILNRAFTGKLVPQDPADESAQILLEHIIAEKTKFSSEYLSKKSSIKKEKCASKQVVLF